MESNDNNITPLCELAYRYGTDKCPQLRHPYTPFYYELFKDKRESVQKVLELGIGCYKGMQTVEIFYESTLKRYYHRGASLKMWRDFFSHAQIFGADIMPETMFEDERIKTYLCDERKKEDLERLIERVGSDIDIVIDDADHSTSVQTFACQTLMPLLKKDAIYIIEDVVNSKALAGALNEYECFVAPTLNRRSGNMLLVVTKK